MSRSYKAICIIYLQILIRPKTAALLHITQFWKILVRLLLTVWVWEKYMAFIFSLFPLPPVLPVFTPQTREYSRPETATFLGTISDDGIFGPACWDWRSWTKLTIKTPNPKCRLFGCWTEFVDGRYSQSCWYFRPALWTIAHVGAQEYDYDIGILHNGYAVN